MGPSTNRGPLRLLVLLPRPLLPAHGGGEIRSLALWSRLMTRHSLAFVVACLPGQRSGFFQMQQQFSRSTAVFQPQPFLPRDGLRALATGLPWTASRVCTRGFLAEVEQVFQAFRPDAVVAEFLHTAPALSRCPGVPHVLHAHNVEATLASRSAFLAKDPLHRWLFAEQLRRTQNLEGAVSSTASLVMAVSEGDAAVFRNEYRCLNVLSAPHGYDSSPLRSPPSPKEEPGMVLFVGALDWRGNLDGVEWFVHSAWPRVRSAHPQALFRVVGRNPPSSLKRLLSGPGLELVGEVPEVPSWWARAQVVVMPLRIAAGARVKMGEAWGEGKAVVATDIAAEGSPAVPGVNCLIANDPLHFADEVIRCLSHSELRLKLGREGRKTARLHTWEETARIVEEGISTVVNAREIPSAPAPHR